jgi:drug/metabolite transporter (DMT)-like permease
MQIKAHAALLGVSLIYASNYTIAKTVMPTYLTPEALVFMRILTGSLVFWLISLWQYERVERSDFGRLLLCGLLGSAINMTFFFKGLSLTKPINAALIMLLVPFVVLLISSFLLKERITKHKVWGISIGILGAGVLVSGGQSFGLSAAGLLGDLFVSLNATSYAFYLVLVKKMMLKYRTTTVLKWVFSFGFLFSFPFNLPYFLAADFQAIPINIWFGIVFILIAVTILTYLFNGYALRTVAPSAVSTYVYLQPLWASIIALSFGKDTIDASKVAAYFLIMFGVLLVNQSPNSWARLRFWRSVR